MKETMSTPQSSVFLNGSEVIPARIVIGVTGHRRLAPKPWLTDEIRSAVQRIGQMAPPLKHTPLVLTILSPLAEGADRLVAQEVLKVSGSRLEVILPMDKDDYIQDFTTAKSRQEFEQLLSQAAGVRRVWLKGSRPEVYEMVGRYVVEQCDVLIALWDGTPLAGEGGTAGAVEYARKTGCPLIWINTDIPGQVTYELGEGLSPRPFRDLEEYNTQQVDRTKFQERTRELHDFFMGKASDEELDCDRMQPTFEYVVRHYVRADMLALHYEHLYYWMESVMYVLALLAIVVAGVQILFLPEHPEILISEVVLMLVVLSIFWAGQRQRWHGKWIDCRFLAERFRSALFMAVANTEIATLRPPRYLSLAYSSRDWMVAAFSSFWSHRPRIGAADSSSWDCVRRFLCKAWIEDQIRYHGGVSERHYRRHHRMVVASYVLFALTICVALLHILKVGPHAAENAFAFMAIVFPAIGASIAAIRTHRDYLRNSMRATEMVRHLQELRDEMMKVQDCGSFLGLLKGTEETMLRENEDWRVVVRFNTPEAPA